MAAVSVSRAVSVHGGECRCTGANIDIEELGQRLEDRVGGDQNFDCNNQHRLFRGAFICGAFCVAFCGAFCVAFYDRNIIEVR